MNKLNLNVRINDDSIFHDSRADCRTLLKIIKILTKTVNELIDNQNRLEKMVDGNK